MIKEITTLTLLAAAATTATAQAPRRFWQKNPEQRYALQMGRCTMEIDAANGGRIVSLRHDSTEVLSQLNFPNQYGSTFWTSPQKEWNWPPIYEHDMAPYEVSQQDGMITMTSPLSEKLPLRITKRFETDAQSQGFKVTYTLRNEGTEPRKVAPWEITRVPQEGAIYCDADPEKITGSNGMPGLTFKRNAQGWAQYDIEPQPYNRKVNADGRGWLTYVNKGLALTKRFDDLTEGQWAPDEAEIQVYVDQGGKVVEIESQGAYVELQPGQETSWSVTWLLSSLVD